MLPTHHCGEPGGYPVSYPLRPRTTGTGMPQQVLQSLQPLGVGMLLAELPPRPMTAEQTCCESLLRIFGFEAVDAHELGSSHARLLDLCSKLPAAVPGHEGLSRRLRALLGEVAELQGRTVRSWERGDVTERIERLCQDAEHLKRSLEKRRHMLQRQQESRRLEAAGPLQTLPSPDTGSASTSLVESESGTDSGDASAPATQRQTPRRRAAAPAAPVPVPVQHPRPPAGHDLGEVNRGRLRNAIDTAHAESDGHGRLSGRGMLQLGQELVRPFDGHFVTRLRHAPDYRNREMTIAETIEQATRHVDSAVADAVRAYAQACHRRLTD